MTRLRLLLYFLLATVLLGSGSGIGLVPQPAAGAGRPTVQVPHGWRPVSYGGVVLDVPSGWPTHPWTFGATCMGSIDAATVLLELPPPGYPVHNCPARSISLAAVVDVGAGLPTRPPCACRLTQWTGMSPLYAGTGIIGSKMKPTEINGLRLYLASERVSAQEPQSPKKLFVDLVLVYVPLRKLWVFVSVGTPHSHLLPGGAPGRAMQIVHTIRSAPLATATTPVYAVLYPALGPPVAGVGECNIPVTQTADGNATPLGCPESGINAAAWAFYYRLSPWLLSLGPGVTPSQLITAACKDEALHATVPEATDAAQLAGTYYGWPLSYAQNVNTQLINGVCGGA